MNNYSNSSELIWLTKIFFANSTLFEYASTIRSEVTDVNSGEKLKILNTNELLRFRPEVVAGKTGTTIKSGQNLILLVEKNKKEYLIIILNSSDRYDDANKIIDSIVVS
jgi:D-alanyl-D-alanine carboxypeptidase (penicillin-binding protein 5/6)